uniref:Uncharacterized protein n=1 Tax=Leersia perrieri TaxID=77586 RepID=A0A0D9XJ13_9ORYZ
MEQQQGAFLGHWASWHDKRGVEVRAVRPGSHPCANQGADRRDEHLLSRRLAGGRLDLQPQRRRCSWWDRPTRQRRPSTPGSWRGSSLPASRAGSGSSSHPSTSPRSCRRRPAASSPSPRTAN